MRCQGFRVTSRSVFSLSEVVVTNQTQGSLIVRPQHTQLYKLDCLLHNNGDPLYIDIPLNSSIVFAYNTEQPGLLCCVGQDFQILTNDVAGPHYTVKCIYLQ